MLRDGLSGLLSMKMKVKLIVKILRYEPFDLAQDSTQDV